MKRVVALILVMVMTTVLVNGCGSSKKTEDESINIMVWGGAWSEEEFTDFEAETGIKVNVSYIDNTDVLISKLIDGNVDYDVVDIEAAYVKTFVDNELLQKIDKSDFPYQEDMIDSAKGTVGDENLEYTTPDIAPGYTTIIYNKETCPIEIKSFKDLADPKLADQVAMVNSTISLYGVALEALGYEANSTKESEIKEANELLKSIKQNVKAFVGESAVSQLESGECSVALSWDYPILCNDSKENWDKFEIATIDTPYEKFTQYWGIPATSKKAEAAKKFINFVMQPEELAKSYTEYGSIPLLKKEVIGEFLSDDYYENPCFAKYEEVDKNCWMVPVNDEQIELMDIYYTELMGE